MRIYAPLAGTWEWFLDFPISEPPWLGITECQIAVETVNSSYKMWKA